MKVQKLNEAIDFTEAENPGKGSCCPTAVDYTRWIKQALDHLGDAKFDTIAKTQLTDCARYLLDSKQEFENFNTYWNERFPAMIDFLDRQLEMIPGDVIASLPSDVVEEDLASDIRKGRLNKAYQDESGTNFDAEDDNHYIQFQDRELHTHEVNTKKDRWGNTYMTGFKNRHPRVSSQSWGRAWDKRTGEVAQFTGPKYKVRAEMAKYLDSK